MRTPLPFPVIARGIFVGALLASGAVLAYATADAAIGSSAHEPGIWTKHEYSFAFMGFTSTYSCDGLADKLKILLVAAGARSDAKVRAGACALGFGRPDKFARADLTFYTLAPVGTGGGAANTVSNTAGKVIDKAGDMAPVDGRWVPHALSDRRPRDLGVGDCELVEQFRSNVLPLFTTRNIDNHTTCIPHQESGSVIDLKFDSFGAAAKVGSTNGNSMKTSAIKGTR